MTLHPHYADSVQMMSFRASLEPDVPPILDEIASSVQYVGASNAGIMSILYTLIFTCRAQKVLQLGTFVGFSSLILGDALRKVGGRLITVDPDEAMNRIAEGHIRRANLDPIVTMIEKSSIDPEVLDLLKDEAPFDVIYIDSLHDYGHAKKELSNYWPMLRPSGFLCLDDASKAAAGFDTSGEGGVYRAVQEWLSTASNCEFLLTRTPLWPHPFGVFLATKVPGGEELAVTSTIARARNGESSQEVEPSGLLHRTAGKIRRILSPQR